jgi:hypothetical protein
MWLACEDKHRVQNKEGKYSNIQINVNETPANGGGEIPLNINGPGK